MRCPRCAFVEDKVIDSRTARNGDVIRRRRECVQCGHRFTTYEEVVKPRLRVIKHDSRHEELDRVKLSNGVKRACEKRPISLEQIEVLVDTIIAELESEFEREVPSSVIGRKVMEKLKDLDEVAYVRFASVYRQFTDVGQFLTAIKSLTPKDAKDDLGNSRNHASQKPDERPRDPR
jgi:transcriptional repressor NrdR